MDFDIVIIGGGPAGLAAAIAAKEAGVDSILILERDGDLGGILNQCIHNGFGLHTFKEELTGPEYADRFINKIKRLKIDYRVNTTVLHIEKDKKITAISQEEGFIEIKAKAIILAMGCRERPRGALNIPGFRPAGIYSAGTAQRLINISGYMPGKEVVILGSGDIGLIMARRMTLEGANVKLVAELMPYSGGLKRNIVQCLNDYDIPLQLSHTIIQIHGKERLEGVTIAQVDENRVPIPGTNAYYSCDTLLLSVGLIPENELSYELELEMNPVTLGPVVDEGLESSEEGIFACGNVLHVHDLVDYVSEEAALAGNHAAGYVKGRNIKKEKITINAGDGVRYTIPNYINKSSMPEIVKVRFRVGNVYKNSSIEVYFDDFLVQTKKRRVMAPGEMEEIYLKRAELSAHPEAKSIRIKVKEEVSWKKEI